MAQMQTVTMETSKAVGEKMMLVVNSGAGVSVDWGNGAQKATTDTIVGTLASQTITVTGGEYWTALDCSNTSLTAIDIQNAQTLTELYCQDNNLATISIINNPNLEVLNCANNQLTVLPLSKSVSMTYLNCANNQITRLTLTNTTNLETCICANNKISIITNLKNCTKLKTFWCQENELTDFALADLTLESLICNDNKITAITSYNDSEKAGLETLICDNNSITSLDLKSCDALLNLSCDGNGMTSIVLPSLLSVSHKLYLYSLANNKLGFTSLPSKRSCTNMLYAPQENLTTPEYIMMNGTVDYSDDILNYAGTSVGTIKWYKADGTALVSGTDYTLASGVTTFLTANRDIYGTITSTTYTDLTLRTSNFSVLDPLGVETVTDNASGFICKPVDGGIQISTTKKTPVNIYLTNGTKVWSGTVDTAGARISLPGNDYIVNSLKVRVK